MKTKLISTGNETVSLPCISLSDASVESISFLHMASRGMLEVCGSSAMPLFRPVVYIDGNKVELTDLVWQRKQYWIPTFVGKAKEFEVEGVILAPIDERGFCFKLQIKGDSRSKHTLKYGIEGSWSQTLHTVNESKVIASPKYVLNSGWNHGYVFEMRTPLPLFAFAPMFDADVESTCETFGDVVNYSFLQTQEISHLFSFSFLMYLGVAFEEVSAATSSKEMLRQGYEQLHDKTVEYLKQRTLSVCDPKLDKLLNTNLFFSMFYSTGKTLDTEEKALVTSRSPRYYVSSAYWDRDSLLWSFPAILLSDSLQAKSMLEYFFTRQIKNVGIHSRYIDGTVLEPGFELDELCAPVLALARYYEKTNDRDFLTKPIVVDGINYILDRLYLHKAQGIDLFDTWLQPTDDTRVYPYITYDNVLCHVMLKKIVSMFEGILPKQQLGRLDQLADSIKKAIEQYCIAEVDGKKVYVWSTDCKGKWDIYDEPPGSLQLLSFYGFCSLDDEIYRNTVQLIRRKEYPYSFFGCPIAEIGCPHAPHPWVLSIANSMLCGEKEQAKKHLYLCTMDNYIACESVDEYTGESATGDAFATCAGFLAYAIYTAFHL